MLAKEKEEKKKTGVYADKITNAAATEKKILYMSTAIQIISLLSLHVYSSNIFFINLCASSTPALRRISKLVI